MRSYAGVQRATFFAQINIELNLGALSDYTFSACVIFGLIIICFSKTYIYI